MQENTASTEVYEGLRVRGRHVPGDLEFGAMKGYLGPEAVASAAAYFQAEHDEKLGRWRWPENPHFVVYPAAGYGHYVRVLNERDAFLDVVYRDGQGADTAGAGEAARAYFDAHPERMPWADAREGEIWDLDGQQYLAVIDTDGVTVVGPRFFRLPLTAPSGGKWEPARFPHEFVSGSKAYPEDAS